MRYDKTLSEFLTLMDLYEMGAYQPHLFEKLCQEGYAPGCLARGITALNPKGTADYDPELNRKQAEEFFQKGCAIEDFPVCRLITETRKDDGFRDPQDEERVVTGILMLSCDLGADEVCGDAAMRLFEAGDFQMARGYATKGCAMKNPLGVPYRDPRSCDYRKRALAKLAEAQEVPAELEEPVPAALEATTDKQ